MRSKCAVSIAYCTSSGRTKSQTTASLRESWNPRQHALAGACGTHGRRQDPGKDHLYGELARSKPPTGRPQLRYKDVCIRDLKAIDIELTTRKAVASDWTALRQTVQKGLSSFEQSLTQQAEAKRKKKKARGQADRPATDFTCVQCGRDCHFRVGFPSYTRSRRYISITTQRATP